jgi:hypothetical protein
MPTISPLFFLVINIPKLGLPPLSDKEEDLPTLTLSRRNDKLLRIVGEGKESPSQQ